MSEDKLKPCPFCGSNNLTLTEAMGEFWTLCGYCEVSSGMESSLSGAYEAWNTRVPDLSAIDEAIRYFMAEESPSWSCDAGFVIDKLEQIREKYAKEIAK